MKIKIKINSYSSRSCEFLLLKTYIKIRNGKATYSSYSSMETIHTKTFNPKNMRKFIRPFNDVAIAIEKIKKLIKEYNEDYF